MGEEGDVSGGSITPPRGTSPHCVPPCSARGARAGRRRGRRRRGFPCAVRGERRWSNPATKFAGTFNAQTSAPSLLSYRLATA